MNLPPQTRTQTESTSTDIASGEEQENREVTLEQQAQDSEWKEIISGLKV
jgi:hypothetical protein